MSNKRYGCRALVDVKNLEYSYNWDYIVSSQIRIILSELHNKVENPDFTTLNLTMSYNTRESLPVMDIIVEVVEK